MLLYIKKAALNLMELDVHINHKRHKSTKGYSFVLLKKELVDTIDGFQEIDNIHGLQSYDI